MEIIYDEHFKNFGVNDTVQFSFKSVDGSSQVLNHTITDEPSQTTFGGGMNNEEHIVLLQNSNLIFLPSLVNDNYVELPQLIPSSLTIEDSETSDVAFSLFNIEVFGQVEQTDKIGDINQDLLDDTLIITFGNKIINNEFTRLAFLDDMVSVSVILEEGQTHESDGFNITLSSTGNAITFNQNRVDTLNDFEINVLFHSNHSIQNFSQQFQIIESLNYSIVTEPVIQLTPISDLTIPFSSFQIIDLTNNYEQFDDYMITYTDSLNTTVVLDEDGECMQLSADNVITEFNTATNCESEVFDSGLTIQKTSNETIKAISFNKFFNQLFDIRVYSGNLTQQLQSITDTTSIETGGQITHTTIPSFTLDLLDITGFNIADLFINEESTFFTFRGVTLLQEDSSLILFDNTTIVQDNINNLVNIPGNDNFTYANSTFNFNNVTVVLCYSCDAGFDITITSATQELNDTITVGGYIGAFNTSFINSTETELQIFEGATTGGNTSDTNTTNNGSSENVFLSMFNIFDLLPDSEGLSNVQSIGISLIVFALTIIAAFILVPEMNTLHVTSLSVIVLLEFIFLLLIGYIPVIVGIMLFVLSIVIGIMFVRGLIFGRGV